MSAVEKITPHLHSLTCPDELRSLPGWLMWRFEQVPGEAKPRKVPYYAGGRKRSGTQGSPEDVAHLVTFEAAVSAAARKGFDGVGIATLPQNNVTIIDFDRAIVKGELLAEVDRACIGSYAEFSPSGEGVHLVVKGSWPNKKNHGDKADPSAYGVETFHSKGFVTWTGNPIPATEMCGAENTIAPMNESLLRILTSRLLTPREREQGDRPRQAARPMGYHPEQISEMLAPIDPEQGHDQWLRIGMAIHHETDGEGFDLWDEWSETGSSYPGREQLQYRWDSFGRSGTAGVTIRSLLKVAHAAGATIGSVASADDFEDLGPDPDVHNSPPGSNYLGDGGIELSTPLTRNPFKLLTVREFLDRPRPGWVIKGLMPMADLGVVYGASGAGKSFIMLDLVMAIARGVPWRGLRVRQGKVVYICAEGAGGFRNRVEAYCQHHGIDGGSLPLLILDAVPNLLDAKQVKFLGETIEAEPDVALIVCDTFAQMTPGANENAGEDMGKAISHVRHVGRKVKATVVLVHHSGKDAAKGARGWSGIRAAADFEMEVTRDGENRALNTTKQKDADDSESWGFKLQEMIIALDEDDDPIKSAVVVESDVEVEAGVNGGRRKAAAKKRLGVWEQTLLDTFQELAVGGDVLKTELILRTADKRADAGSIRDRRKNVGKVLERMSKGGGAVFISSKEDDYVTLVQ